MNTPVARRWCPLRHAALYGAALITLGCATTPSRRDQSCAGQRVLIVNNQTSAEIDVVARDGNVEKMLGSARPGRHEFSLTDVSERSYFVAKRNGNYVSGPYASAAVQREVEFRIDCR